MWCPKWELNKKLRIIEKINMAKKVLNQAMQHLIPDSQFLLVRRIGQHHLACIKLFSFVLAMPRTLHLAVDYFQQLLTLPCLPLGCAWLSKNRSCASTRCWKFLVAFKTFVLISSCRLSSIFVFKYSLNSSTFSTPSSVKPPRLEPAKPPHLWNRRPSNLRPP